MVIGQWSYSVIIIVMIIFSPRSGQTSWSDASALCRSNGDDRLAVITFPFLLFCHDDDPDEDYDYENYYDAHMIVMMKIMMLMILLII